MAGVAAAEMNMSRRAASESGCRPALLAALLWLMGQTHAADVHPIIPLWPAQPGAGIDVHEHVRLTEGGEHIVSNVQVPSITVYVPPPEGASGAAVVVVPGGGHTELWMDHEGYNVAAFLADHGIAAFVLKYRLAGEKGSRYKVEGESLADLQRAIRMVRSRSDGWGIDPARIGVMGFSAGGGVGRSGRLALRHRCGRLRRFRGEAELAAEFSGAPLSGYSARTSILAGFPARFSPGGCRRSAADFARAGRTLSGDAARRDARRAAHL